jgi:hypothetical protein
MPFIIDASLEGVTETAKDITLVVIAGGGVSIAKDLVDSKVA